MDGGWKPLQLCCVFGTSFSSAFHFVSVLLGLREEKKQAALTDPQTRPLSIIAVNT